MLPRSNKILPAILMGMGMITILSLISCDGKHQRQESVVLAQTPTATSQTALRSDGTAAEISRTVRSHQGGDQLPVVVDPDSPGSCAVVSKVSTCGYCCSDVFAEDSERWHQCMNACAKVETNSQEH
jgi:hypothetical protein